MAAPLASRKTSAQNSHRAKPEKAETTKRTTKRSAQQQSAPVSNHQVAGNVATNADQSTSTGGEARATAVTTAAAAAKSKAIVQLIDSDDDDDDTQQCARCMGPLRRYASRIKCHVCSGSFHFTCTGVPEQAGRHFTEVMKHIGWVCNDCKLAAHSAFSVLQVAGSRLTETVAILQSELQSRASELQLP